ncbi:MAG: hypothetical protein ABSG78_24725 [Verrucomicrobiota bacterium]|jgi:hypothetical protein
MSNWFGSAVVPTASVGVPPAESSVRHSLILSTPLPRQGAQSPESLLNNPPGEGTGLAWPVISAQIM